jgi:hypothetical protein
MKGAHGWQTLADELGENRGYLYNVANGRRRPSYRLIVKLGLNDQRRVYDISTRQAREIGIGILNRLYTGKCEKPSV